MTNPLLSKMSGYWTFGDVSDDLGAGVLAEACSFSDSCDAYADHRATGRSAMVFRVEPSGAFVDVTGDADKIICERAMRWKSEAPAWIGDAA